MPKGYLNLKQIARTDFLNKIPSVMSFGDFWLMAKKPNLFIHIIYIPWQGDWKT
jgi:hypothetical protein